MTDLASRPTRTDTYEATLDRISALRREALLARTLARAFNDLTVDIIDLVPSRGDIADHAARDIADYATGRANVYAHVATRKSQKADELQAGLS